MSSTPVCINCGQQVYGTGGDWCIECDTRQPSSRYFHLPVIDGEQLKDMVNAMLSGVRAGPRAKITLGDDRLRINIERDQDPDPWRMDDLMNVKVHSETMELRNLRNYSFVAIGCPVSAIAKTDYDEPRNTIYVDIGYLVGALSRKLTCSVLVVPKGEEVRYQQGWTLEDLMREGLP